MELDLLLEREKTGRKDRIMFKIPPEAALPLTELLRAGKGRVYDYYRVRLSLPFRRRSTGKHSQNHRANGFIAQISRATQIPFDGLKEWLKIQSIAEGYPFITLPTGEALGKSERDLSVEECTIFIGTIERIAAEWGVELVE
jgi:hypothetical protein